MNEHNCPLCTDAYAERTNLHVHLEVEHRKSEIVSFLIDSLDDASGSNVENEQRRLDEEAATPPA